MGDTVTTPTGLTMAVTQPLSLEEDVPQVSQAVLDAARASMQKVAFDDPMPIMGTLSPSFDAPPATSPFAAPLTAPMAPSGFQHGMAVHVTEVVHDPELDEAVIAFANADFDHCEQSLLALLHPGASRHDSQECWLVLFDFYRAVDLQQKFDQLAVSYAQKFGVSAPQWFHIPRRWPRSWQPPLGTAPSAPYASRPPWTMARTPSPAPTSWRAGLPHRCLTRTPSRSCAWSCCRCRSR